MVAAMEQYPDSCAVFVRRHGVYVWGETWQKAKIMWVLTQLDFTALQEQPVHYSHLYILSSQEIFI
jgi:ribulose-5-phosphate 4-epimerase/fuculose-1-phosphate aldolase